jgi:hypothetical protein
MTRHPLRTRRARLALIALAALMAAATCAQARVKLVLLPQREDIRLRFQPGYAPLMEEERVVALDEGVNEVELAWTGLPIQPESVIFDPLQAEADLTTLSVALPPSEQQSLVWRVASQAAQNVRLRISYVLADTGMYERTDYAAKADPDETKVTLSAVGRVNNNTGLAHDDVSIEASDAPPVVLSLDRDERRELPVLDAVDYPLTKTYTSDSANGGAVELRYEWTVPIEQRAQVAGKARAFLEAAGSAGEAAAMDTFLGEDFLGYVPSGEDAKLLVGLANDLKVERKTISVETINERFTEKVSPQQRVMHDQREKQQITVENHRQKPVTIALVEHHGGDWVIEESSHPWERKDAATFQFKIEVPPGEKVEVTYTLVERYITD